MTLYLNPINENNNRQPAVVQTTNYNAYLYTQNFMTQTMVQASRVQHLKYNLECFYRFVSTT